ncbi:MAG: hypothetical protein AB7O24_09005 [Kofleriaceae bacterium]
MQPGSVVGQGTGRDRLLRGASISLVAALGAAGIALDQMYGAIPWLAFLFFVMSGWGYLAVRALRLPDPDFGLRAMWGVGSFIVVAGCFLAAQTCNTPVLQGLVAVGFLGFVWRELATPESLIARAIALVELARERPKRLFIGLIVLVVIFVMLGGVAKLGGNVWDDDIAYTAFLKRLLDIGDMNEPFSFRRLSAYGGQIVFNATASVRGDMKNVFLIDHGLCQGLVVLLLWGHVRARKLDGTWQALIILVFLLLPNTSINTASYYSGVAGFIALYRTAVVFGEANDRGLERRTMVIAAVLGAAVCTLRQNYIPVVVLFLGFVLINRLWQRARETGWRSAWSAERGLWGVLLATAGLSLLPYCIAAYQSNNSFLFPMLPGTWNKGLQLTPYLWSWFQELEFLVWCCIEPHGIVVIVPLFCVLIFVKDDRSGRPLTSLFVACTISFLILIHSFTSSDPENLWRYAFGYAVALSLMLAAEVAPTKAGPRTLKLGWLARWVVLASLLFQVLHTRAEVRWRYRTIVVDIRKSFGSLFDRRAAKASVNEKIYQRMQAAMPVGARVMTIVDYAGYFDFARNDLVVMDMPGWSALEPGYPAFETAEAVRNYFRGLGFRYVAWVTPDTSAALYRRSLWVQRLHMDNEVSRTMAAYLIFTIDAMRELANTQELVFDEDGYVVIDLETRR